MSKYRNGVDGNPGERRYVGINVTLYAKGEAVGMNRLNMDDYSGGTGYPGRDILGSVRGITNEYGVMEGRYEYRDYKPEAARFTTEDPVRDEVNRVDLWGLGASDKEEFEDFMQFTHNQGVERTNYYDSFIHEKIADNWDQLSLSVRNYEPILWGGVVDDLGNHDVNQRLPDGYHLTVDANYPGVYVHYDVINPLRSPSDTALHGFLEARFAPDLPNNRRDLYPDWPAK